MGDRWRRPSEGERRRMFEREGEGEWKGWGALYTLGVLEGRGSNYISGIDTLAVKLFEAIQDVSEL